MKLCAGVSGIYGHTVSTIFPLMCRHAAVQSTIRKKHDNQVGRRYKADVDIRNSSARD